jgi:hypothetical protein
MSLNQVTQPLHNLYTPILTVPDRSGFVRYATSTLTYIKNQTIRSHITSLGKKHTIFCNARFQRNVTASVPSVPIAFHVGLPGFLFPAGVNESAVVAKLAEYPTIDKATQICLYVQGVGNSDVISVRVMPKTGTSSLIDIKDNADGDQFEISFTFTAISA